MQVENYHHLCLIMFLVVKTTTQSIQPSSYDLKLSEDI